MKTNVSRWPVSRNCLLSKLLAIGLMALCVSPDVYSQSNQVRQGPRIGLVLGGGGAKGMAHVGVLEMLEKYRVPVDAITGTSMGAIVGSLYAAGYNAGEIKEISRSIAWESVFDDESERRSLKFRRKQVDQLFLTDYKLSFKDGKLVLPKGLVQGQKLFLEISKHLADTRTISSFDELPIPFRAIAADLETDEAVVLKDGDLATAVFASMAVPGLIPPVEREGMQLVDGGIANNLPIDVARSMNVDLVIVVDVGADLKAREEIGSFVDVLNQMSVMLTTRNTRKQLASLEDKDVLIQPLLDDFTAASFDRSMTAIERGTSAAEIVSKKLKELGLSEQNWRRHISARKDRKVDAPVIDFIEVEHDSALADEVIKSFISVGPGEKLNADQLNRDIEDIYGLDTFDRVSYGFLRRNGQHGLLVYARKNPARQSYSRFGVLLESDFESDTRFQLGASFTRRDINRFGGEWRSIAEVGNDLVIATELYQPFGSRLKYFLNPFVVSRREDSLFFEDSNTPIAEIRVKATEIGLDIGMELGRWGELRLGGHLASGSANQKIGDPGFNKISFDDSFYVAQLDVDTLDQLNFPTQGSFLRARWESHHRGGGGDFSFDQYELKGLTARSWDRNTILLASKLGSVSESDSGALGGFSLGGFQNLSGLAPDQLSGPHMFYAQAAYYRKLNDSGFFLDTPVYLGGTIEAGNVYDDRQDITLDSMIWAGSLFAGINTPLGPVYVATGITDNGDSSVYLFVGQVF